MTAPRPFERTWIRGLVPWIVALALGSNTGAAAHRTDITVKGSDTLVILMRQWARTYSRQHPGINVQVTGGGTGTGMAALINRTTELCLASRALRPDETEAAIKAFGRRPLGFEVALDALVVFVHESNPVTSLSLPQIAGLFTGRFQTWSSVGGPDVPVVLYSRENSSGSYEFFKERVLDGHDFASRTQTMPGTAAVLAAVSRDRWGIGYGGVAFASGVRQVAIETHEDRPPLLPSESNVMSAAYPIARPLRIYVNPAIFRGPLADFLNWIRSNDGQAIVRDIGFFPLPADQRAPGGIAP